MPPTFRAVSYKEDASGQTSRSATFPAGTANGDILLAITINATTATTPTTPSGWTRHAEHTFNSENAALYSHVVDGSEGGSVTFVTTSTWMTIALLAYSDSSGVDAFADFGSAQVSTTTPTVPSVTTTLPNDMVIGFISGRVNNATTTATPPAGWTERAERGTAGNLELLYAMERLQPAAGASPTAVPTMSSSHPAGVWTYTLAIKAVAVASSPGGVRYRSRLRG